MNALFPNFGDLDDFLLFATPLAALTALASGLGFGWVVATLRPATPPRTALFLMSVMAALWYLPQMVQRMADPALPQGGMRTLGALAVMEAAFVVPAWLVLEWHARRRGP